MSTALLPSTLPPGPRLPALLMNLAWMARPHSLLDRCARRYGDTFSLRFSGFPPMVLCSNPEDVRAIFTARPEQVLVGPISVLRPIMGDNSLFLLDGERHHAERRMLLPPFHGERMQRYGEVMASLTRESIARWPLGRPFALHPWMQDLTLQVMLRTVLGLGPEALETELGRAVLGMLDFSKEPILMFLIQSGGRVRWRRLQERFARAPWTRFQAAIDRLDRALLAEIERRRGEAPGEDVLSLLLSARDEAGRGLPDEALRDELKTLLIAGHETTATALTWTLYELSRAPEVLAQVRSEAGHALLDAVIRETMRLHPLSLLVARLLAAPLRVGGVELPPGVVVVANIYGAQRRAASWPEPERFLPERFLDRRERPFEFFPFGGGSRRCVGMAFALFEMRAVLAQILRGTELRVLEGYQPRPVRRGTTFAMSGGFPVVRLR